MFISSETLSVNFNIVKTTRHTWSRNSKLLQSNVQQGTTSLKLELLIVWRNIRRLGHIYSSGLEQSKHDFYLTASDTTLEGYLRRISSNWSFILGTLAGHREHCCFFFFDIYFYSFFFVEKYGAQKIIVTHKYFKTVKNSLAKMGSIAGIFSIINALNFLSPHHFAYLSNSHVPWCNFIKSI